MPFRNIDERLIPKDSSKGVIEIARRNSPSKEIPGSLHPPRSDSPRKDPPGNFHQRLTTGYRDPGRSSPYGESRRQYDKSPIRDRRSPAHPRRSPEMVERGMFLDTSPKPMIDPTRHSPYRERIGKQTGESALASPRKASRSPVGESRIPEVSRGYRMKPEVSTAKETGDNVGSQRTLQENKVSLSMVEMYSKTFQIPGKRRRLRCLRLTTPSPPNANPPPSTPANPVLVHNGVIVTFMQIFAFQPPSSVERFRAY